MLVGAIHVYSVVITLKSALFRADKLLGVSCFLASVRI